MRRALFNLATCMWLLIFLSCSSSDEKANKLFVEATSLVKSAQEAEKTSYSRAFELYEEALTKLEKITSKYPSSQMAVEIVQGKAKIQSYSITEFKEVIVSQAKIKADAEGNPLDCALLIAKSMENADDKVRILVEIARKYAEVGQKDKASDILAQVLQAAKQIKRYELKGYRLSEVENSFSIASNLPVIASEYIKLGQRNNASDILSQAHRMSERAFLEGIIEGLADDLNLSVQTTQLVKIASGYTKSGINNKALEILDQALQKAKMIRDADDRSRNLSGIAEGNAEAGEYDKALQIIKELKNSRFSDGTLYKDFALLRVAMKCVEAKQYDKALRIIKEINDYITSLVNLAGEYVKNGQKDGALEILSQALQSAKLVKDNKERSMVLRDIAEMYAKAGEYNKSLEIAKEIENIRPKSQALKGIASEYTKDRQKDKASEILSQALQAAKKVETNDDRDLELSDIAVEYARIGEYNKALQVAKGIENVHLKVSALAGVAVEYDKTRQKDKASEILSQALQIVKGMVDISQRVSSLFLIANGYEKVGLKSKASEVLSKNLSQATILQVIKGVEDISWKTSIWVSIASEYAKVGLKDKALEAWFQALQLIDGIKDANERVEALVNVANEFLKSGLKADDKIMKVLGEIIRDVG